MTPRVLLEIIALDLDDAIRAADGGADRIELCADMDNDGLTPDLQTVERFAAARLPLVLMAMARPRGGGFVWSDAETAQMEREIQTFRSAGADGVVIGCLTPDGQIDTGTLARLCAAAEGMSVTFHRAFDSAHDRKRALETLAQSGVHRVLTFGFPVGAPRRPTDADALLDAARLAPDGLAVMTGGWLEGDAPERLVAGGIREFHFGRAVRGAQGYRSPVDSERVRAWRTRLDRSL